MTSLLKEISPIKLAFGGASISGEGRGYGFGDISEDQSIALLKYAFDRGIKIYDTAPIYGFRASEQRIGRAFRHNRDQVFIVSKCGVSWHDNLRVNMSNHPQIVTRMLETTLKDLSSSYVDLYLIHWPDKNVDVRFTMEVLSKAKREGKINHIGLCNTTLEEIKKASEVEKIEVLQSELNLFNRKVIHELFQEIKQNERSFMSFGTLDKGILTGRAHAGRKYDESDLRGHAPWWKKSNLEFKFQKYEKLKTVRDEYQLSGIDLAIGHNLMYDEVDQVIVGARSQQQLDEAISSTQKLVPVAAILKAISIIDDE
ncbi:MAG: hypothetical protein A2381_14950 [Bdellovibrionales bacterium RIFOXYB1_FULL_37_110]|nr:MAG: hypothetical protein A2417_10455 [Bdellovibrionales bacterium RIFOXYC1_FULL_37_79]OFZ60163.1 MAG: hypothetical protein A2381_14950 [Bdellovibrionales bacterium RIFOXYB1_FULL_37_110]OFZ64343.1 MAG: hypothetical protein A2577_09820 [Bdellovibrionales bacterium RIFOXYD1_FULL_36_51]